jgi:hypothetical protein
MAIVALCSSAVCPFNVSKEQYAKNRETLQFQSSGQINGKQRPLSNLIELMSD